MRQPLYTRLRPFLRRDLRARLVSALLSVAVLTGLDAFQYLGDLRHLSAPRTVPQRSSLPQAST